MAFQVTAKNGNTFVTDNDTLASSLKKQGHEVVEVDDEVLEAEAAPKAARKRAPKADPAPAPDGDDTAPATDAK